jgi:hypothetical protein
VEQVKELELVINLKTAKALGLTMLKSSDGPIGSFDDVVNQGLHDDRSAEACVM